MKAMLFVKSRTGLFTFTALAIVATTVCGQSKSARLRPSDEYWDRGSRASAHFMYLSGNRKLATVGDTLYMLGKRSELVWTWSTMGPPLTDIPVIDSNGIIYVIGFDLTWAAVDSATGKEKWRGTANGKAVYSQIELYKGNKYLVVTDMTGYRDNVGDSSMEDKLTLCRGNSILWETRIPAGARIGVAGSKVHWVVRRKGRSLRREVRIPRRLGMPLGKICTVADYD
ncbi:MAG TPA: hypothetical protein VFF31_32315 [Blastocatellia bacterium]|nr:hypothetical protein [Blastocatellia bacterium]